MSNVVKCNCGNMNEVPHLLKLWVWLFGLIEGFGD